MRCSYGKNFTCFIITRKENGHRTPLIRSGNRPRDSRFSSLGFAACHSKNVVHDIFAHLLDDPKDLKEETAEHYLLTSVRNRCLNVIRSRQIQERVEHLYLLDLDTTITPTERLEEELKALYKGINQLEPPVCRDIIMQHFRDGVTFKEIAFRLGVSETTVYKHLRRALHQLRTHLNNK